MKKIYLLINILFCLFIVGCKEEKKIESIIAEKNEIVLNIGDKETISYECLPDGVSDDVTWHSSDYNIVTVSDGIITAVNKGTAVITITSSENNNIKTTVEVTVVLRNYNITYVLNEGLLSEDVPNSYKENVGLENLPTPTREGYTFDGWYLNDTLVTKIESTYNKDVTLVAKWTKIIKYYNITYVLNEGLLGEDAPNSYEENVGLENLPIPTREGYTFDGWYLNDTLVTNIESTYNKDVTLVAKWTKIIKYYNITYVLNEGLLGEDVPNSYEENVGLETLPIPTREGYTFDGWYLNDILVANIESTYNKDVTLVAKWTKIIKYYNITYILNGGTFTTDVVYEYEDGIGLETLPTAEKDGYEFVGWFYKDNLITQIDSNINKDVTLSARWTKLQNENTEEAERIIKLIDLLPYNTTYIDKENILNIKSLYDELDKNSKALVTNIDYLNEKLSIIEEIENNTAEITYVLGKDISSSKDELFINFFSDFYLYIKSYHGTAYLISKGIRSVDDFIKLAKNFNAGDGNLTEIGDVAGRFMLTKDINGILENQPETGFFGYCYKNGRYTDLLPFFIRFFAYWRIDERYANTNNYGADTFAESWAPTVDIAKFFYYTNETTYVKTERMLDCFNYTSNVIYGDLPTEIYEGMVLPTNIRLRGYIFDGWYDNPEFTGEKITTITDASKKVILYAKWVEDTALKDKDDAAMVDVYIYNLTTKPANVTKLTVSFVSEMYQALSYNAKSLVKKYSTLLQFEEKFKEEFLEPVNITITAQIDIDINFIRNSFLNDFNMVTNSSITTFEDFINKRYSYMDELRDFFADRGMYGKWGYLLDILYSDSAAKGLKTQINRIKNNESGDSEYVCKALGNLLLAQDASSDNEILIDYSGNEVQNRLVTEFGTFQIDKDFDIDFIRNSFLNDFNMVTNSSITTFEDFINKRYSYMDELRDFFADRGMYGKWGYLLDILYSDSAAKGLKTQINRIKNNESGDSEYVCKALGNLLLAQDASSDNEILIDYSGNEVQNRLVTEFGTFKFIFKTESYLPTINIEGYEFVGYYDNENNLVTKVTETIKNNLIAVYIKK